MRNLLSFSLLPLCAIRLFRRLSYDTNLALKRAVDLSYTAECLLVSLSMPDGQYPGQGGLHPSVGHAVQNAYKAAN